MKVVYLNPVGVLGGGERSLLDLLCATKAADPSIEQHLIVCTQGPLIEAARKLGVDVRLLEMPASLARTGDSGGALGLAARALFATANVQLYADRLRLLLQELEPDLVHSNGIKTHLLLRLAGVKEIPIIWHMRDFISTRPAVGYFLEWSVRPGVSIIANSRAVADDVRATLKSKKRLLDIHVVYNGIDTATFSPGPADPNLLDRLSGLPPADDALRVGLIATYARWKGQELFLEAARATQIAQPDMRLRFYLIGGAIYHTEGSQFSEEELRQAAASLDLKDVGFVPFQSEPADLYRALDIVVHASTQPEPFGRTIVEGMSCGRAVIVSNAGGARELFSEGIDAIGVTPGSIEEMRDAICRLARDAELRRNLGAAARQAALSRFDRDRLGREVLEVYEKVRSSGKPGKR